MADDDLKRLIQELIQWQRFASWEKVKKVLNTVLSDEKPVKEKAKRVVYELSDGETSAIEIAKKIPYSDQTVRNWHSSWEKVGIIKKINGTGKHLISLEEVGLEVPEIPVVDKNE